MLLLKWFVNLCMKMGPKIEEPEEEIEKPRGDFSTGLFSKINRAKRMDDAFKRTFQRTAEDFRPVQAGMAMDASGNGSGIKSQFLSGQGIMPDAQFSWYSTQGFIGYQVCAMLAQHWLIQKACEMPGKDAVRNGYEITVNSGVEIDPKILDVIRARDVEFKLNKNLTDFIYFGRMFGIRIAMFIVESSDPEYYFKPFNPEGITPGSYKGISQIDPYWITPELDGVAAADPAAMDFYEPTWWRVNAKRIHRSHLIIMRNGELADILKPTYIYGGVPVPQKIYERVYAAERTANEAPLLALTKRTVVRKVDMSQAVTNQNAFEERAQIAAYFHDNYGTQFIDLEEEAQQFDTSLSELDAVIMSQYQLVAAAANVPAVKLLGTSPKGFNATGEFEEASYHEELESIQTHDLTPLIQRHHLLLIRSEIAPQFGIAPFDTETTWNPCDSSTDLEQAQVNKLEAETGAILVTSGAIDGADERERVINDTGSGYNGLAPTVPLDIIHSDPEQNG